jgi:hypothetical protein
MAVMQTIKDNPWKTLLGSSGTIITLVGALFTLDARYAHAADVERDKKQIQQVVKETTMTLRQQMLEDKLFELDAKKAESATQRLSPVDAALAARYKRQLEEINRAKANMQWAN